MTRTVTSTDGVGDPDAAPDPAEEAGDAETAPEPDGDDDLVGPDGSPSADDDAVRERARAIRDEQVERACSRLAARGDLTPARREAVATLAERLVERLVVAPERHVETDGDDDPAAPDESAAADVAATAAILRVLSEE